MAVLNVEFQKYVEIDLNKWNKVYCFCVLFIFTASTETLFANSDGAKQVMFGFLVLYLLRF